MFRKGQLCLEYCLGDFNCTVLVSKKMGTAVSKELEYLGKLSCVSVAASSIYN